MVIAAALVLMLVGAIGALLAAVGLPGMWFMLGVALMIDAWWQPDLLTWWPIAIATRNENPVLDSTNNSIIHLQGKKQSIAWVAQLAATV